MPYTLIKTIPFGTAVSNFQDYLTDDITSLRLVSNINDTGNADKKFGFVTITIKDSQNAVIFASSGSDELLNFSDEFYDESSLVAGITGESKVLFRKKSGITLQFTVNISGTPDSGNLYIYKEWGQSVELEDTYIRTPSAFAVANDKMNIFEAGYLDFLAIPDSDIADAEEIQINVNGRIFLEPSLTRIMRSLTVGTLIKNMLGIGMEIGDSSSVVAKTAIALPYTIQAHYVNPVGFQVAPEVQKQITRAVTAGLGERLNRVRTPPTTGLRIRG